jgi:hypothetical protein
MINGMFISGYVWEGTSELGFLKYYRFINFCKMPLEVILYYMNIKEGNGIPAFILPLNI